MNLFVKCRGCLLWTFEIIHECLQCIVAIFNKRVRTKRNLESWIRRNCACAYTPSTPSSGLAGLHNCSVVRSDWSDGRLVRIVGQSLDPEPPIEYSWPEKDLHVGQSSILRRLHICPVFSKSDITENKYSSHQIEEKLIDYLTRVKNKIEENLSLYTLYEKEKKDLLEENYENLSELEISLDFKSSNTMDTAQPMDLDRPAPVQTRVDSEHKAKPIEESMTINQQRAQDFIARGIGLMYGKSDKKNIFYIYCKDLATELNNIVIEINNETCYNFVNINNQLIDTEMLMERNANNDIVVQYRSNNDYVKVSYVCKKKGKYEIRVTYYGYNIPGSPFLLNIEEDNDITRKDKNLITESTSENGTQDNGIDEWIDLPGKTKRSSKRKMSTLPNLFRLKSPKFYETFDSEQDPVRENIETHKTQDVEITDDIVSKLNKSSRTKDERDESNKKGLSRAVSKFYEYDSTESNVTEKSDVLKNENVNPILTLFESFDIQQSRRKSRQGRRNLTYSNSNMKRYNKLIINNQELFQIVTKLDFVMKTLNTNELLDILGDVRNKLDLIKKYDEDIQSLKKQKTCETKKFDGDQISLISEYFTLMHAKLSKKYDTISQLITDNIEKIDFELKQDEDNLANGNIKNGVLSSESLQVSNGDIPSGQVMKTQTELSGSNGASVNEMANAESNNLDILRAKRAREKFHKRGNSKKRHELQNTTSSGSKNLKGQWKDSVSCSFTDINMISIDAVENEKSEPEKDPLNPQEVASKTTYQGTDDVRSETLKTKVVTPEMKRLDFQSKVPISRTISLECSDGELSFALQNYNEDIPITEIHINNIVQYEADEKLERKEEICQSDLEHKNDHNRLKLERDVPESLEISDELVHIRVSTNESQSVSNLLESKEIKEELNANIALENSQSYKGKFPDVERGEYGKDNYCIQNKKFSAEEKLAQRQTNLHIKETNFHCAANLNKNNLKIYDNEDKNERKADFLKFYVLSSEDNIECNKDLNYSQNTNVSDLDNSERREGKDENPIEENEEEEKREEIETEKYIKNGEQRGKNSNKSSCSVEDNRNDEACSSNQNQIEVNQHFQSEKKDSIINKVDLQRPTESSSNIEPDKLLNIKISKNDLITGKVLTVSCEKENIGNTIQMKIELCKCSCLDTINDISTQTEVSKDKDLVLGDKTIQELKTNITFNKNEEEDKDTLNKNEDNDTQNKNEDKDKQNKNEDKDKQNKNEDIQKMNGDKDAQKKNKNNDDDIAPEEKIGGNKPTREQSNICQVIKNYDLTKRDDVNPIKNETKQEISNRENKLKRESNDLEIISKLSEEENFCSVAEEILPVGNVMAMKSKYTNHIHATNYESFVVKENCSKTDCKTSKLIQTNKFLEESKKIIGKREAVKEKPTLNNSDIPRGLVNQLIGMYEIPKLDSTTEIISLDKTGANADNDVPETNSLSDSSKVSVLTNLQNLVTDSSQLLAITDEIKDVKNTQASLMSKTEGSSHVRGESDTHVQSTLASNIPYIVDRSELMIIQNYHEIYVNDQTDDLKLSYSSSTDFESLENLSFFVDNGQSQKVLHIRNLNIDEKQNRTSILIKSEVCDPEYTMNILTENEVPKQQDITEIPTDVEVPHQENSVEIPIDVQLPNEEDSMEIPNEVEVTHQEDNKEIQTDVAVPHQEDTTGNLMETFPKKEDNTDILTEVEVPHQNDSKEIPLAVEVPQREDYKEISLEVEVTDLEDIKEIPIEVEVPYQEDTTEILNRVEAHQYEEYTTEIISAVRTTLGVPDQEDTTEILTKGEVPNQKDSRGNPTYVEMSDQDTTEILTRDQVPDQIDTTTKILTHVEVLDQETILTRIEVPSEKDSPEIPVEAEVSHQEDTTEILPEALVPDKVDDAEILTAVELPHQEDTTKIIPEAQVPDQVDDVEILTKVEVYHKKDTTANITKDYDPHKEDTTEILFEAQVSDHVDDAEILTEVRVPYQEDTTEIPLEDDVPHQEDIKEIPIEVEVPHQEDTTEILNRVEVPLEEYTTEIISAVHTKLEVPDQKDTAKILTKGKVPNHEDTTEIPSKDVAPHQQDATEPHQKDSREISTDVEMFDQDTTEILIDDQVPDEIDTTAEIPTHVEVPDQENTTAILTRIEVPNEEDSPEIPIEAEVSHQEDTTDILTEDEMPPHKDTTEILIGDLVPDQVDDAKIHTKVEVPHKENNVDILTEDEMPPHKDTTEILIEYLVPDQVDDAKINTKVEVPHRENNVDFLTEDEMCPHKNNTEIFIDVEVPHQKDIPDKLTDDEIPPQQDITEIPPEVQVSDQVVDAEVPIEAQVSPQEDTMKILPKAQVPDQVDDVEILTKVEVSHKEDTTEIPLEDDVPHQEDIKEIPIEVEVPHQEDTTEILNRVEVPLEEYTTENISAVHTKLEVPDQEDTAKILTKGKVPNHEDTTEIPSKDVEPHQEDATEPHQKDSREIPTDIEMSDQDTTEILTEDQVPVQIDTTTEILTHVEIPDQDNTTATLTRIEMPNKEDTPEIPIEVEVPHKEDNTDILTEDDMPSYKDTTEILIGDQVPDHQVDDAEIHTKVEVPHEENYMDILTKDEMRPHKNTTEIFIDVEVPHQQDKPDKLTKDEIPPQEDITEIPPEAQVSDQVDDAEVLTEVEVPHEEDPTAIRTKVEVPDQEDTAEVKIKRNNECLTEEMKRTDQKVKVVTEKSRIPTKIKRSKFLIRKTYFEQLVQTPSKFYSHENINKTSTASPEQSKSKETFDLFCATRIPVPASRKSLTRSRGSIDSIQPIVQTKKNIFENKKQKFEDFKSKTKSPLNRHESLEAMECIVKNNKNIFEQKDLQTEDKRKRKLSDHVDSLDGIESKVSTIKFVYETAKSSVDNNKRAEHISNKVVTESNVKKQDIPKREMTFSNNSHESLKYRIPNITELKNVYEEVTNAGMINKAANKIPPVKKLKDIHVIVNNCNKISPTSHDEFPIENQNTEMTVSPYLFPKDLILKSPVISEVRNIFERPSNVALGTEPFEKLGNINHKSIFEKSSSNLQQMKSAHESLEYIEPIVAAVKQVFETKSKDTCSKANSAFHFEFKETNVTEYLCNDENNTLKQLRSPQGQDLYEQSRLTLAETYVNNERAREAVESKVNSERDCDIESEADAFYMQTNDENCINEKPICNTRRNLQGALDTGSSLVEEKLGIAKTTTPLFVCEDPTGFEMSDAMSTPKEFLCSNKFEEVPKESQDGIPQKYNNNSNQFFVSQGKMEEATFSTWASNEEFSKSEVQLLGTIEFGPTQSNIFELDRGLQNESLSDNYQTSSGSLENENEQISQDSSSSTEFKIGSSDLCPEKLCYDESQESSLDYDSIIQAPSLDEALEKLDLKLKKEVVKDFKNDPEKLDLFRKNKSINVVTNEEKKLKICFEVVDHENLVQNNWENSSEDQSDNLIMESILLDRTNPEIYIESPTDSDGTPNNINDTKFNIVELKEPTEILLMGPAEKEIIWGITDEEAVQIFHQTCGKTEPDETREKSIKMKSPVQGKLHHQQPRRSPSPLALFLNSSLGTIDETQEDFSTSVNKIENLASFHQSHSQNTIYSDSETNVNREELKKMSQLNPSIQITNYDIDHFVEIENSSVQVNNEKIIDLILEETLLRPMSRAEIYEDEDVLLENTQMRNKKEDSSSGNTNNIFANTEPTDYKRSVLEGKDTIPLAKDISESNENCKVQMKNIETTKIKRRRETLNNEDLDFECKPEFVKKWKNYWDERFNQTIELQKSNMTHLQNTETQNVAIRQRSPSLEVNENFVLKQRQFFEKENTTATDNIDLTHEKITQYSEIIPVVQTKIEILDNDISQNIVQSINSRDSDKVKAEIPPKLHLVTIDSGNVSYRHKNCEELPRKPSIKITDIVKKQRQKFESLLRRSFKSKKVNISKKENFKDPRHIDFSMPFVSILERSPRKIPEKISRNANSKKCGINKNIEEIPNTSAKVISSSPLDFKYIDDGIDEEDNLSATFKIMKDVNMIPHNQSFSEWRQQYIEGKTQNMNTETSLSDLEGKRSILELEKKINEVKETDPFHESDSSFDNKYIHPPDPFRKDKEEIVQEWKKDLYKKLAKPFPDNVKTGKSETSSFNQKENDEDENLSNEANQEEEINNEENPTGDTSQEYDERSSNIEDANICEPTSSQNKTKYPQDCEQEFENEVSLPPSEKPSESLKYSSEYPYLPKTPVDEYQHRSDLYKELLTRKQLFKLTKFVKK